MVKMMPMFKVMGKFSRTTIAQYLEQFKDPFLKQALALIMPAGYSMISLVSTLASLHSRDAGFPRGGSLEFARSVESRFLALGGNINYRSRVTEVLVNNGRATGVLLEDGSEVTGDIVVSAADLHSTVYGLLKGRHITPLIKTSFRELPVYSSIQVSLGVDCDLSGEAEKVAVKMDKPINLGGKQNGYIYLTNYVFDPSLAPAGKTVVAATLYSTYEHWQAVAKDKKRYNEKKNQLAERVIKEVEKRFPKARDRIEVVDVATPITYNRYTGVWKGAYMAWVVPPEKGRFKIPKQLPGLDNFYQIGQWVEPPSGLPGSMLTGRHVVQIICSHEKVPFRTGQVEINL